MDYWEKTIHLREGTGKKISVEMPRERNGEMMVWERYDQLAPRIAMKGVLILWKEILIRVSQC